MAWLPRYQRGLCWQHEDATESFVNERSFRRRLLSTRPGTAIDPKTDAADEGTLRETECVQTRWRNASSQDEGPVAMVGYVFIRVAKAKDKYPRLSSVASLPRIPIWGSIETRHTRRPPLSASLRATRLLLSVANSSAIIIPCSSGRMISIREVPLSWSIGTLAVLLLGSARWFLC